MNTKLLIDAIVQQTTVLIAELSTASGIRAPLAHVADQVFLQLAREIEAQGVSRTVVADMFGMAIRSYQKKVQRLAESETDRGTTLWHAVLDALQARNMTRAEIQKRFAQDPEREVYAVLHDLVTSGFLFCTGRGPSARYGATSEADRAAMLDAEALDSLAHVIWLEVHNTEPVPKETILARFSGHGTLTARALEELAKNRRVTEDDGLLRAANFSVPLGGERGWEAAVLDHYQTAVRAIASKLSSPSARESDQVGGSTIRFCVYPGHPEQAEVLGLLENVRTRVLPLWERVATYNAEHPPPEDAAEVAFYFGQSVVSGTEQGAAGP